MKIEELKNFKKILILGYGLEGKSTERFLKKLVPDSQIGIADVKDGADYLKKQRDYDLVIKTPGISKNLITVPYTTATNIFFANCKGQTIGITGSKGKSTTASLVYSILKEAGKEVRLCGNIGQPMLQELLETDSEKKIFVCELSSYQLDDIQHSPHISVITNLFPEHMDYHGSIDSYYRAKKNIVKFSEQEDYYCYNPNCQISKQWAEESECKAISSKRIIHFDPSDNPLIGEHNLENIDLAITVAKIFNISDEVIKKTVKNFQTLPHRLQFIGKFKNILFYDDAISTTPESTICAIKSLSKIRTIFLGGLDRGYDFQELVKVIIDKKIPNIVLFPNSGQKIKSLLLRSGNYQPIVLETKDMKKAVEFAYRYTPDNSVCLLSTASPSYSVWKNFEEKGDLFQFFVKSFDHEKKN